MRLPRMQPFIVTLATWSIFGGIALWVLPTTGGSVPQMWVNVGNGTWLGIGSAVWILAALVILWHVFKRTRPAVAIRSVGSSQEAAYLCGVPIVRTITSAYAISGLCGALAGLYYITQATSGSPTAGNDYILPSVVAVVIGGTSLAGGRGGFGGTLAGAFILTLIGYASSTRPRPAPAHSQPPPQTAPRHVPLLPEPGSWMCRARRRPPRRPARSRRRRPRPTRVVKAPLAPPLPAGRRSAGPAVHAPLDRPAHIPGPGEELSPIDVDGLAPDDLVEWLQTMVVIREFEQACAPLAEAGKIPGGVHSAAGQEAVAVGAIRALTLTDIVTSSHRSHHHSLAKGLTPRSIMAELYGKATGCLGGRGGHMHLADFTLGLFGSNGALEGFEIVRRRLFTPVKDETAREQPCLAYSRLYGGDS